MRQKPAFPPVHPAARRRAVTHPVTLLVWHDIVPKDKLVWFDTTTEEFDAQIRVLLQSGAKPIPLNSLYSYLATGAPVPPPGAVVLCFDDNTAGIYDLAAPRLRARGWPFAVSAHTAYIGIRTSKNHNTYATLQEMERQGAVIVSQTHTHPPDLTLLNGDALRREFVESKRRMETGLGHATRFVTYPSGKWDNRVAGVARDAGYVLGLTEDRGAPELSPHLLGIHRYSTHRRWTEAIVAIRRSAKG